MTTITEMSERDLDEHRRKGQEQFMEHWGAADFASHNPERLFVGPSPSGDHLALIATLPDGSPVRLAFTFWQLEHIFAELRIAAATCWERVEPTLKDAGKH